jgi:hypothetical protein
VENEKLHTVEKNLTPQPDQRCANCTVWVKVDTKAKDKKFMAKVGFKTNKETATDMQIGVCRVLSNPLVQNHDIESDDWQDNSSIDSIITAGAKKWFSKNNTSLVTMFLSDTYTLLPTWIVKPTVAYAIITKPNFYCAFFKSNKDADTDKTKATS